MKNKQEKSDPSTVAKMSANKPGQAGAESAEPREGTEGNTGEQHTCRTPSRESVFQGLGGTQRNLRRRLPRVLVGEARGQGRVVAHSASGQRWSSLNDGREDRFGRGLLDS
jgi:hypothetical protein